MGKILRDDAYYDNINNTINAYNNSIDALRKTRDGEIERIRKEFNGYIRNINKEKQELKNVLRYRDRRNKNIQKN